MGEGEGKEEVLSSSLPATESGITEKMPSQR